MGETLAIGSLLLEGHPVRLAGQDSRRGTFGQRHATLVDYETGAEYTPLASLSEDQANFYVYDSFLSEFAAVGFEYGYSVVRDNALVAWEAQFGDFTNGAQSILDEFISSGEAKWGQRSAVTLLLPHGYEGQGPDHSSARPERYLQMCAEDNMTVAMPSTPSSYFHLLRWQAMSGIRRPLIVMTPKSLLRLRAATSPTAEFTEGAWRPVLGDPGYDGQPVDGSQVRRVLLCSGKVYYDLLAARTKRDRRDVALVRLEQLYPVPQAEVAAALAGFPDDAELVWVQEEPANMGAWSHLALTLELPGGRTMRRVSRKASAAPSVGSHHAHEVEQAALVDEAFA
jgi:2-oxoglutarate dehydrogenase complex dehydrogenase (E1) component-like enzyme